MGQRSRAKAREASVYLDQDQQDEKDLARLLDRRQQLTAMPHAAKAKRLALQYLIEKFETGRGYSEREVNAVLSAWHTFGDHARLRRELCDAGLLHRLDDGSYYWREPEDSVVS